VVEVFLRRVRDRGAVVARVSHAVPVEILLPRVGSEWAVVTGVADAAGVAGLDLVQALRARLAPVQGAGVTVIAVQGGDSATRARPVAELARRAKVGVVARSARG